MGRGGILCPDLKNRFSNGGRACFGRAAGAEPGGSVPKSAFKMLTEPGDIPVAHALCNPCHGDSGGEEEFGGFFETEPLKIRLETESVVLAKEAGKVARASKGDVPCHRGQFERAMQAECKMGDGASERIMVLACGSIRLLGDAKPDSLHMGSGGIFGCSGIPECNGLNQMLVFFCEDA